MTTYYITRLLLVRFAGLVLLAAFATAYFQNTELIGATDGLLPADIHLTKVARSFPYSTQTVSACGSVSSEWFEKGGKQRNQQLPPLGSFVASIHRLLFVSGKFPSEWKHFPPLQIGAAVLDRASCLLSENLLTNSRTPATGGLPSWAAFRAAPTLLWWVPTADSAKFDAALSNCALAGMIIGAFMLLTGRANSVMFLAAYILMYSVVAVGQNWYSFGWESQLLELLLLLTFSVPFFSLSVHGGSYLEAVPRWLLRWHVVRVMLGAGLIKLRGDPCWRDTVLRGASSQNCMMFHYETQPIPGPLSIFFHALPPAVHLVETICGSLIFEVVVPLLMLVPFNANVVAFGGSCTIFFMAVIIVSGNLAFLNWLTIVPAIACLNDDVLMKWTSFFVYSNEWTREWVADMRKQKQSSSIISILWKLPRFVAHAVLLTTVVSLSTDAVSNLLSARQGMNLSHHWTHLVNSHGNFGGITKTRDEVMVQGLHPPSFSNQWKTYQIKYKPRSDKSARPPWITPYHCRMSWLAWFAGFMGVNQGTPHFIVLLWKMLQDDQSTQLTRFIGGEEGNNPFESLSSSAPTQVRVIRVPYKLNTLRPRHDFDLLPLLDVIRRFGGPLKPLAHLAAELFYGEHAAAKTVVSPLDYWRTDGEEKQIVPPVSKRELRSMVEEIVGKKLK